MGVAKLRFLAAAVFLLSALADCATPAPLRSPGGLSAEAASLGYLIDMGCLPYMLGEKTETQAMGGARLSHNQPLWIPFDPDWPGPPYWSGRYRGLSEIDVGPTFCNIKMKAGDAAEFRSVTRSMLARRFGPGIDQEQAGYRTWTAGAITGCHAGVWYSYYAVSSRPSGPFAVEFAHMNCDQIRIPADQREAR